MAIGDIIVGIEKKSKIINENEVAMSIAKTINDAEEEANLRINSAYITIPGKYVTIVQNSVVKEIKDKFSGISIKDVNSALMMVKDIELPDNKTIIDIVPEQFKLADGNIVSDPVGCMSESFTVNAEIILADKDYVKQLHQIFKKVDLEIDGIVPVTLAERNLVLDANELNDHIMLLDIGAGNTEIGIFSGNKFIYTNTIPLGGENITNDIAVVLDISIEEAEKLKRQYGLALKSFIDNDNDIILNTCNGLSKTRTIKSSELIEIIEARIEEIFSLINKDITANGNKTKINNVILTGQGITNINKSDVAGKIALNIPVKMSTGRLISTIRPSYRTAYSLVRYIAARPFAKSVSSSIDTVLEDNFIKALIARVKDFFYS